MLILKYSNNDELIFIDFYKCTFLDIKCQMDFIY